MDRDSYLEGVRSAWLGERFGEVFFNGMAERARRTATDGTSSNLE